MLKDKIFLHQNCFKDHHGIGVEASCDDWVTITGFINDGKVLNLFFLEWSANVISKHTMTSLIPLNYCSKVAWKMKKTVFPMKELTSADTFIGNLEWLTQLNRLDFDSIWKTSFTFEGVDFPFEIVCLHFRKLKRYFREYLSAK